MLDDRLDALLRRGREPEPDDDGFTDRVMTAVRGDELAPRRRWRRFVTRPTVLAAAAVLVAGGALAAVRTTAPDRDAASEQPAPARTAPATSTDDEMPATTVESTSPPADGSSSEPEPTPPVRRHGDVEWGYTSSHTAYVKDPHLRMETETYTNQIPVSEPHRVTMTLTNIGDRPVGIYAPDGCALTVAGYRAENRTKDPSEFDDPSTARHPGEAKVWNCAGPGDDPRTREQREPSFFVLEPNESLTEDALLFLPEGGEWAILGHCQCHRRVARDEPADTPKPTTKPSRSLFGVDDSSDDTADKAPPPSRPTYHHRGDDWRMFTPPIRVTAS